MENNEETTTVDNPSNELIELHAEAIEDFNRAQIPLADEREQSLEDRRFYSIAGAQWEGNLGDQFENKPKFEVNKIHLSVMRIINEYRNNRITVDFLSDGNDKIADTCDKLYRNNEAESNADEAYDNAFEEAVGGGFGAWRLKAEYEDEENEDDDYQKISILPIYDADSCVYFDPNAKRQDKKDAKYCFVLVGMNKETYEEEYGEYGSGMTKQVSQTEFDWAGDDVIYIAEYYKVEHIKKTINIYESVLGEEKRYDTDELEGSPELLEELLSTGYTLQKTRVIKKQKVHKYIMDGTRVLEDCGYIAGKYIPIVPMYGKRWVVDNIERCMGHVRLAKDAQRLKNMQLSKLAEFSASSGYEKPIFTPEQMAGHELMWSEENVKDFPYMLINPLTDANGNEQATGAIGFTKPPSIPPAMAALLQLTDGDMRELLGDHQAVEKVVSNISGEAIAQIKETLDMQTFIYMSNMAKAMKRSGEIWLSMAKELLVEESRTLKGLTETDEIEYIQISKPTMNQETNEVEYLNDITKAKLDVKVGVTPSTTTKRAKTVRDITQMLQITSDPELQQVLSSTAVLNMEGEGVDDIKQFIRKKLIKMGAIQPTEKEAQDLQEELSNIEPTAQEEYLRAESKKLEAETIETLADTEKTVAETESTKVKTLETFTKIQRDNQTAGINSAKTLNDMIQSGQARLKPGVQEGILPNQGEF